ncbi:TetR/AcrR family transcriptional regulator [Gordonia sp. CPCC 206044]|uniref:TetR/AcrR family transcriptional regulator n=1 Tax=Gordonia sp. CPCC 206044 TaxID=3140793 RepID=UPI003AF3CBD2
MSDAMLSEQTPVGAGGDQVSSVRVRLLDAMAACLLDRGFRETTVADIVRVARTSRRTFYQEFPDKVACFFALLRMSNDAMMEGIAAGVDPDADATVQIRQAVTAYVVASEQHPEITWSWIRELPALGEPARELRLGMMEKFIALLVALTDTPQMRSAGTTPVSRATAVMIWGGIRELTADAVERGAPLHTIVEPATQACVALVGANICTPPTDAR